MSGGVEPLMRMWCLGLRGLRGGRVAVRCGMGALQRSRNDSGPRLGTVGGSFFLERPGFTRGGHPRREPKLDCLVVANTSVMPSTNPDDGNATAGAKLFKAKCVLVLPTSQRATLAVHLPTA